MATATISSKGPLTLPKRFEPPWGSALVIESILSGWKMVTLRYCPRRIQSKH